MTLAGSVPATQACCSGELAISAMRSVNAEGEEFQRESTLHMQHFLVDHPRGTAIRKGTQQLLSSRVQVQEIAIE